MLPEMILDITLWVMMALICAMLRYKLILFSREWTHIYAFDDYHRVLGMPDIMVWQESTLDSALCVKSKMAIICQTKT